MIALLLPGLAMAAPIAGPCGMCGDGESCHVRQLILTVEDTHSCCETSSDEALPATVLGSSNCECGRDAPLALTADTRAPVSSSLVEAAAGIPANPIIQSGSHRMSTDLPPAPPPPPPAYLIDCAFLT